MGKSIQPGLHLEFEADDGYAALGYMSGMTTGISTDYYMESVLEYAHSQMANDFDVIMSALASASKSSWKFQHVYEPGYAGVRGFELWRHQIYGRGKSRQASFTWVDSKVPILKPEERADDPNDPMHYVDPDIIEKLSDEDYIFRMRAPIMEYGLTTVITPRPGTKALFIPTKNLTMHSSGKGENKTWAAEHFRFDKVNIPDWGYRNPQEPSLKGSTVGQFTKQWVDFWSGAGAAQSWDSKVLKAVNGGIAEMEKNMGMTVKRRTRRRSTQVGIATFSNAKAAEESGRNLALAFVKGQAKSYKQAAAYIKKKGYFGGETGY